MQNIEQLPDFLTATGYSYLLIFAAEFGDKSQLVCMALAARYRSLPVLLGAILAFMALNTLAVIFGVALSNWIPDVVISSIVAVLFLAFGFHALTSVDNPNDEELDINRANHSIFISTFLLITLAELGDKTQLAIVALSSTNIPQAIWLGSTLALISTSLLGIWAGKSLLKKFSFSILHRFSGVVFILLAAFAIYKTYGLLIE